MLPPRATHHPKSKQTNKPKQKNQKNPTPDMRSPLLSCYRVLSKSLQEHTGYGIVLGFSHDMEGESLLLRIACTSEAELRDPPSWN